MARPEVFTKEWADEVADKIPQLMEKGESIAEVCKELEMSKESFYKCKSISTKFSDAVKRGTVLSEAWWAKLGRGGAAGQVDINATTWIFNMKNRFNWTDKQEVKAEQSGTIATVAMTKEDYAEARKKMLDEDDC